MMNDRAGTGLDVAAGNGDHGGQGGTGQGGPPVASLRERKKRSTRTLLRRCAVALVAERGVGAVTVEDIAAAADVSPRTFFNYFACKEDAVVGWDPVVLADLRSMLVDRPATEAPLEAVRHVVADVIGHLPDSPRELLERLAIVRSDPHLLARHVARFAEAERELAAALAERRGTQPAHDHYASLVVATVLAAGRVALMAWCDQDGAVPLADLVSRNLDLVAAGLSEPTTTPPRRTRGAS